MFTHFFAVVVVVVAVAVAVVVVVVVVVLRGSVVIVLLVFVSSGPLPQTCVFVLQEIDLDQNGAVDFQEFFCESGFPPFFSWESVDRSYIHTVHVWYIYLHSVDLYGKCR